MLCAPFVNLGWDATDDDIDRFVAEWGRIFERAGKTRAAD